MAVVQGFPRRFRRWPFATVATVRDRVLDYVAATVGVIALTLGAMALVVGRVELGVSLVQRDGVVVVDSVWNNSPAARAGIEPGMVLTYLNGVQLIELPQYSCADDGSDCYDEELEQEVPPVLEPTAPVVKQVDPAFVDQLIRAPVLEFETIRAGDLAAFNPDGWGGASFPGSSYVWDLRSTAWGLFAGAILMIVGGWWLATGRAGASLQPLGVPLAVATAMPFLVAPIQATWHGAALMAAGVLVPLGVVPLGFALASRIDEHDGRRFAKVATLGFAFAAMLVGASALLLPNADPLGWSVWMWLIAASVLIPGLIAAGPLRQVDPVSGSTGGRLLQSAELAVAGATPVMALLTNPREGLLLPLSAWLVGIAIAGRSTIRPLARLAVRATLQRDLIVAATEAERARVAADIHDDALQELTLLVHHLDESGDEEGAGIARTVSDRLRAICGDLRLPILDDLGVGPALDWLVLRIERLAGGEVRLERTDGARPPADVELAFFRVAQEALGNAVKHGAPPIVVRYRATDAGASLSIDDAGPGIVEDAAEAAEGEGHFGLVNMRQRAEAIGAILDIRKWPNGGTHVALEWRSH
jgi:signal transduction histidine kinase